MKPIMSLLLGFVLLVTSHLAAWAELAAPKGFQLGDAVITPIQTTTSISQHGITWTFAEPVGYGQFVNGDYWVLDPGSGVVITGISNTFHSGLDLSTVDYDGSMADCLWDKTTTAAGAPQGLDSRVNAGASYNSALNINKHLPYTALAGKSILSAISWQSGDTGLPSSALTGRPWLKRIAILTIVSSSPAATDFRPSYAVGQKAIYSSIGLATLPLVSVTATIPSISVLVGNTQGPWTDLTFDYQSEGMRASDNYGGNYGYVATYNENMATKIGDAILASVTDISGKTPLINNIIQIGIDYYGLLQNGAKWKANGGHQHGYKLPILYAGKLLNNSGMLAIGTDYLPSTNTFQDDNTFYITSDLQYPNRIVCGDQRGTPPECVNPSTGLSSFTMDRQYDATNFPVGTAEWGIRHWESSYKDNSSMEELSAVYRHINARPLIAHALAARILGLKTAWNNNAFFEYHDRWYTWAQAKSVKTFNSTFANEMWNTYRKDY